MAIEMGTQNNGGQLLWPLTLKTNHSLDSVWNIKQMKVNTTVTSTIIECNFSPTQYKIKCRFVCKYAI